MKTALLASVFCLASSIASAQLISYEGPQSKRTPALRAYSALQRSCSRFGEVQPDITDYSLHVGLPEMTGDIGELARKFDAREVAILVLRMTAKPRLIPQQLRSERMVTIMLISSASFSGAMLTSPLGLWLCDKTPIGDRQAALLQSGAIGDELDR